VKRATENLAKVVSIERLKNRIIAPNITNSTSSSDEEYMNINDKNSVSDYNKKSLCISNNILEINEAQNIPQAVFTENIENGRKEEIHNEQDMEALDLSDENDEIVFQDEVDQKDDTLQSSGDNDEDIDDQNHFETEEQKTNYVAKNLREWAIYNGNISKRKLDNLLLRLNQIFPTLPKSYKTLLHTPKNLDVCTFPDGSMFWYKGIVTNLDAMLLDEYLEKYGNI